MNFILTQSKKNLECHAGALLVGKYAENLPILCRKNIASRKYRSDRLSDKASLQGAILTQAFGMTNFNDIECINNDSICSTLIGQQFSQETFRQRLNELSLNKETLDLIDLSIIETLKKADLKQSYYGGKFYHTLDIDVTPFINPNNKKEGVSYTYKG